MPDEFADALDRMDINFEDAENVDFLIMRLSEVLGQAVSTDQLQIAQDKFRDQAQLATTIGFSVTRFTRGENTVIQLRDARGRFVTDTLINERPGQKTIVQGAGRLS